MKTPDRWAGPRLGEHNQEVYCGFLGLAREQMEGLRQRQVI